MPDHADFAGAGSSSVSPDTWNLLCQSSGAILIGGLVALFLSGAVFMQVIQYYQTYTVDTRKVKTMVHSSRILDCVHSAMICIANWQNLVVNFGRFDRLDRISWCVDFRIDLGVHSFFSYRVHTLSRGNWYITTPLVRRLAPKLTQLQVSTGEMIRLKSYIMFVDRFDYVFTLGLSTSTALDVLITSILCFYLRQRKSGLAMMDRVIDVLTVYTVENGMLTCVATVVSLICASWVRMPNNLIFLGLHFAISKLYASSFMASLNARKGLANRSQGSVPHDAYALPVLIHSPFSPRDPRAPWSGGGKRLHQRRPVQVTIDIEQTIHHEGFEGSQDAGLQTPPLQDDEKIE
ncbi:hypothetical protein BV20DRAFT_945127 [Pilatotrama ljubarskyi]|nr:hypothetical protein BV20DRAFT_945127 [Pilatotrama ljubarskyi]